MSPEIIVSVQKFLTEKFAYMPQIGEFLFQDFLSSEPKFTKSFHSLPVLKFIQECGSIPHNVYRKVCYELVKIGNVVTVNSRDFKYHGCKIQVDKKRAGCLEGHVVEYPIGSQSSNKVEKKFPPTVWEDISVRISSTSYRFIEVPYFILCKSKVKIEKVRTVKVGQLVYIIDPHYRPRYEKYDQFRVVWSGLKYIRVEPVKPKYKTWDRTDKVKRIGDATYEINTEVRDGRERTFRYNSSCYSKDIPHSAVITVGERFGTEAEENYHLMNDLGL
jgi:hypothetical protein